MKRLGVVLALVCALAACQSSEERAENHYRSAVTLIGAGDVDRGLVELRNVFRLNGQHHDARALYARTVRARGNLQEAYGQYLRLLEQEPGDPEAALALVELALQSGRGPEMLRHARSLRAIHPDVDAAPVEVQAALLAADYVEAAGKTDAAAMNRIALAAKTLLETHPERLSVRQIVISQQIAARDWQAAEALIDDGIAVTLAGDQPPGPEGRLALRQLYDMKLNVLQQFGDKRGLETALKEMVDRFPEDPSIRVGLVRWYVGEQRLDEAEAVLRGAIDPAATDVVPRIALVRFLTELRGPEAGLAELDAILAADPRPGDVAANLATLRGLRAESAYRLRDKAAAIAEMRAIIDEAVASGTALARVDELRLGLATMEDGVGNRAVARELVAAVLKDDPSNTAALRMEGGWLIDEDRTAEAMVILRSALGQAPRDTGLMTLMARAHERAGNRELMAEMLSLAVEASNRAPAESIRYALYLASELKLRAAEDVLVEALRLAPSNVDLLVNLTQVHIAMEDWPRAEQDIARLRELAAAGVAGPQGAAMVDELQVRILARQNRVEELSGFLESRSVTAEGGLSAAIAGIRSNVISGRLAEALQRAAALADSMPDNAVAQFVHATVLGYSGKEAEAEAILTMLVDKNPGMAQAWTALSALYVRKGDMVRAGETLERAIAANPGSIALLFAYAGWQERDGDLEGAITTYETLYAMDSNNVVIANNLASMLTTARSDAESLERGHMLSRRLRGLALPAFQDTYGWIAFLNGDIDEALATVEPAARALPDLALVQYHLGRVYAALGRRDEAAVQYEKATQLLGRTTNPVLEHEIEVAVGELAATGAVTAPAPAPTTPEPAAPAPDPVQPSNP